MINKKQEQILEKYLVHRPANLDEYIEYMANYRAITWGTMLRYHNAVTRKELLKDIPRYDDEKTSDTYEIQYMLLTLASALKGELEENKK